MNLISKIIFSNIEEIYFKLILKINSLYDSRKRSKIKLKQIFYEAKVKKRQSNKVSLEKLRTAGIGRGLGIRLSQYFQKLEHAAPNFNCIKKIKIVNQNISKSLAVLILKITNSSLRILLGGVILFWFILEYLSQRSSFFCNIKQFISNLTFQPLYVQSPEINIDPVTGYPFSIDRHLNLKRPRADIEEENR
jgi:hypothetical protein